MTCEQSICLLLHEIHMGVGVLPVAQGVMGVSRQNINTDRQQTALHTKGNAGGDGNEVLASFPSIVPSACHLQNEFETLATIGVRGGGGGGGGGGARGLQPPPPPIIFQIAIFGPKNQVIFGQNHLIFGQAMEKIFGQLTSAPLNEIGPVRPCSQHKHTTGRWFTLLGHTTQIHRQWHYVPANFQISVNLAILSFGKILISIRYLNIRLQISLNHWYSEIQIQNRGIICGTA